MASPQHETGRVANQGTARVWDRLAPLVNTRSERAQANASVFRCDPCSRWPFEIQILERHLHSTQVFVPMTATQFLVVVAQGGDRPDLSTLSVFIAGPEQGISYHPGIWHHPMIALHARTDFFCLVWEDRSAEDCTLVQLDPPYQLITRT